MTDHAAPATGARSQPVTSYSYYVVALLTLAYCFNFIDRQILGIVSQDLKEDLNLSDSQLGLLKGFAFALLYTLAGIPIARWADRANRVGIVSLAVAVWSGFTMLCGMAQNFTQLLLARIGVGIGEAGGTPPSHSIISDYFPKEQRATALAIFSLGIPLGLMFAYLAGGWVNATFGWRYALIAVGAPGLLLAALIFLTVREPQRGASEDAASKAASDKPPMSVWEAARYLFSIRTYAYACGGITAASFFGYAAAAWIIAFYIRVHIVPDLPTDVAPEVRAEALSDAKKQLYLVMGIIAGVAYGLGTFLGGWLTEKASRQDKANYMRIPALAMVLCVPLAILQVLSGDYAVSLIFAAVVQILLGVYLAPTFSLVQTLAPLQIRALSTAIFFFVLNIIALGVGPSFVGLLSDMIGGGGEGLRWAMFWTAFTLLISAAFYWMASRHANADWEKATGERVGP